MARFDFHSFKAVFDQKNHSRPKEKPQKEKRTKSSDSINSFS